MKQDLMWFRDSFFPLVLIFLGASVCLVWAEFSIDWKSQGYVIVQVGREAAAEDGKRESEDDSTESTTTAAELNILGPQLIVKNESEPLGIQNASELLERAQQVEIVLQTQPQNLVLLNESFVLAMEKREIEIIKMKRTTILEQLERGSPVTATIAMVLYNNIAMSLAKERQFETSSKFYNKAIATKTNWFSHFGLSQNAFDEGKVANGRSFLNFALQSSPSELHHLLYFSAGSALSDLDKLELSHEFYKKSADLKSDFLPAKLNDAVILRKLERMEAAEKVYNQILLAKPDYFKARYNYAFFLRRLGRSADAITELKAALLINSNHMGARKSLATIYFQEKDYTQALVHFKWLEKKARSNSNYQYWLGKVQMELKNNIQAAQHLQRAIEFKGGDYPEAWVKLGELYLSEGKRDLAKKAFEDAIKLRPDSHSAYYELSQYHKNAGDKVLALSTLRAAVERNPKSALYRRRLAETLTDQGMIGEALQELTIALQTDSSNINTRIRLGELFTKLDQPREANVHFQFVLRSRPKKSAVWYNLGNNLYQLADYPQALEALSQALAFADAGDAKFRAKALKRRALVHKKMKNLDSAMADLKEVLELDEDSVSARVDLAGILHERGDRENAKDTLETALRLKADSCRALDLAVEFGMNKYLETQKQRCLKEKEPKR